MAVDSVNSMIKDLNPQRKNMIHQQEMSKVTEAYQNGGIGANGQTSCLNNTHLNANILHLASL